MDNLQNISPKIREVLDGKGTPMPDIGAIIAISLLSDEYLTIINCKFFSFFSKKDISLKHLPKKILLKSQFLIKKCNVM